METMSPGRGRGRRSSFTASNEKMFEPIIETLSELELETIDPEWVDAVWDSQFTECIEISPLFHDEILRKKDVTRILSKTTELARKWVEDRRQINDDRGPGVSIWSTLVARDIKYRSLIALLFYFMDKGQGLGAHERDREACMKATSLYFLLLSLPGSGAFKIFHAVLYGKALNTFKLTLKLHLVRLSPKKKRPGNSQQKASLRSQPPSQKRKTFSRSGSICSGMSLSSLPDDDDDEDEFDEFLSPGEVGDLTNSLNKVLFHFLFFLDNCSLKRCQESLELSVTELVDLTHLETGFSNLNFNNWQKQSGLSAMAFNAYIGLQKLCQSLHGSMDKITKLIFKALLPGALMVPRGASEIAPRGLAVIRDHTLHFIKHLISVIGEESHEAAEIFIQHLAANVPDRAEFRSKAASAIVELTKCLPPRTYTKIVRWFLGWSYNELSAQRCFAVEVMGVLIQQKEGSSNEEPQMVSNSETPDQNTDDLSVSRVDLISHKFIFGVLLARCRDVSAKVRAKAFKTLSDIMAANDPNMAEIIRQTFDDENRRTDGRRKKKKLIDFAKILQDPEIDLLDVDPLPDAEVIIDFLRQRAQDESVYVRKSSLQVMENIAKFSKGIRKDLIEILAKHCCDPSLMVRKQMISSMTDLMVNEPESEVIIRLWVQGVFPLILDAEQKACEKALECIWECLFGNLEKYTSCTMNKHFLPWKILKNSEELKMSKYLSRACATWQKNGLLKPGILAVLRTHVNTEHNNYAWLLLALVTGHVPLQDPHFVMEYFNTSIHTPEGVGLYTLLQVLRVLFSSVSKLKTHEQKTLQRDLITLIRQFSLPPELISTSIDIATVVSQLDAGEGNSVEYRSNVDAWATDIISLIDEELGEKILKPTSEDQVESPRTMRQIFTLGELALICPHQINKRMFLLMQSVIFQQGKKLRKGKGATVSAAAAAVVVAVVAETQTQTQTQSTQPPECAFTPTTKMQALSILTLNKMCVTNEEMAKKIVPAYGRLLDESNDKAIKNNIIFGLSDMCVRFANLVEALIPQMTTCLRDPSSVVKRTTLITLIYLLQEDYLKISGKGAFFFRIIQTLSDPSEEIRQLTTFFLQQRLLKKSPKVMYQHFIEAIFHFNEYEDHSSYNKFVISDKVKELFSLKGPEKKEERMLLYKFMLENMTDEQRFQMTYKLCQDILGGAVDGQVKLGPEAHGLLQDTLACLASEEIKLVSLKSRKDEETDNVEDSNDFAGAVAAVAKKTIISQVVKKNIIENIIPIIIALKHKLEEQKNPLIDDLMNYLRELMKDYKNEVKDILSADKRLANEIQFDLKRWEEQQRSQKEAADDTDEDETESVEGGGGHSTREGTPRSNNDDLLRRVLKSAIDTLKKAKRSGTDASITPSQALQNFLAQNMSNSPEKLPELFSPRVTIENLRRSRTGQSRRNSENEESQKTAPKGISKADSVLTENEAPTDADVERQGRSENPSKTQKVSVSETEAVRSKSIIVEVDKSSENSPSSMSPSNKITDQDADNSDKTEKKGSKRNRQNAGEEPTEISESNSDISGDITENHGKNSDKSKVTPKRATRASRRGGTEEPTEILESNSDISGDIIVNHDKNDLEKSKESPRRASRRGTNEPTEISKSSTTNITENQDKNSTPRRVRASRRGGTEEPTEISKSSTADVAENHDKNNLEKPKESPRRASRRGGTNEPTEISKNNSDISLNINRDRNSEKTKESPRRASARRRGTEEPTEISESNSNITENRDKNDSEKSKVTPKRATRASRRGGTEEPTEISESDSDIPPTITENHDKNSDRSKVTPKRATRASRRGGTEEPTEISDISGDITENHGKTSDKSKVTPKRATRVSRRGGTEEPTEISESNSDITENHDKNNSEKSKESPRRASSRRGTKEPTEELKEVLESSERSTPKKGAKETDKISETRSESVEEEEEEEESTTSSIQKTPQNNNKKKKFVLKRAVSTPSASKTEEITFASNELSAISVISQPSSSARKRKAGEKSKKDDDEESSAFSFKFGTERGRKDPFDDLVEPKKKK